MSKAVLVMDMPEICGCCKMYRGNYLTGGDCICRITGKEVELNTKPDDCPLRPMPEKKQEEVPVAYTHFGAYIDGWNACIDAIGGGDGD